VLLISVFVAHVTHQLVERPLREVGRRLAERVANAAPPNPLRSLVAEAVV
jgi:peptidoglycan/LPS O-acetylase OafA/YrhL